MAGQLHDRRTVVNRVRDQIAGLIRQDGLLPGDRMPTEAALTRRFGISRPAVREALKLLEQDGTLTVRRGSGRFVLPASAVQVDRPITAFESITAMLRNFGYDAVTRLLSVTEEPADASVAGRLGLAEGEPVVRLEKLRLLDMLPILYSIEFLPRRVAPRDLSAIDWAGSLLAILDGQGTRPCMSAATISAGALPAAAEALPGLGGFGPVLLITETCHDPAGRPVIHALDYHRGSHFSFSFTRR